MPIHLIRIGLSCRLQMSIGAQISPKPLCLDGSVRRCPAYVEVFSFGAQVEQDMGDNNLPRPAPVKGCSITTRAKLLWKEDWQNLANFLKVMLDATFWMPLFECWIAASLTCDFTA